MRSDLWQNGFKKTKQREAVFAVLSNADKPLTAMEICTGAEMCGKGLWLSTVYRVLDLFVQKGIAQRNVLAGGDVATYEINKNEHRHYVVCTACRKVFALEKCPLPKTVHLENFCITGHRLEIYGYCEGCYAKK
ncbi:MAG: Zinc-specific metallo-regulatory protein [Firmicutes bacterium ADurb.Bin193]|nr:MAG: Zinc-specific metallo-regulatory protein [Firmicutes bacterium ADurb.Bin193]